MSCPVIELTQQPVSYTHLLHKGRIYAPWLLLFLPRRVSERFASYQMDRPPRRIYSQYTFEMCIRDSYRTEFAEGATGKSFASGT